jgi:DNA-binding NarL/FixJ family response regulator
MDDFRHLLPTDIDGALRDRISRFGQHYRLTTSEEYVLSLLLLGKDIPAIIEESGRSRATIKTHVLNIFSKTSTHRQAELVSFFFRNKGGFN